jgi:ABC-type sugar transport system ATPase subunit
LAANARLLFMDEPTASLTRHEVDLLLATVRRLKAQGVAIVFVSHRLEEVVEIAERVTVLRDGRKVGTFPASEIDDHRLAELMTGRRIEHAAYWDGRSRGIFRRGPRSSSSGWWRSACAASHWPEALGPAVDGLRWP